MMFATPDLAARLIYGGVGGCVDQPQCPLFYTIEFRAVGGGTLVLHATNHTKVCKIPLELLPPSSRTILTTDGIPYARTSGKNCWKPFAASDFWRIKCTRVIREESFRAISVYLFLPSHSDLEPPRPTKTLPSFFGNRLCVQEGIPLSKLFTV